MNHRVRTIPQDMASMPPWEYTSSSTEGVDPSCFRLCEKRNNVVTIVPRNRPLTAVYSLSLKFIRRLEMHAVSALFALKVARFRDLGMVVP